MNYTEAITLAKQGEERGFGFLYANTQKSKYYLALQYMKDEELAQDVLQESYIKAFSKLKDLEQPEAFPQWLGRIVANTAKNMLVKKQPSLFSDLESEDGEESLEYRIEDVRIDHQPELSYTRQETAQMVHEMIDTLSEEQRMCILMFYMEEMSIKEIAATLGCSENTVKSRLNYGRKNLKAEAETLQKKGYKLYGMAPIPLLLLLLGAESKAMAAEGTLAVDKAVVDHIFSEALNPKIPPLQTAENPVVKKGILHTAKGKIAIGAVSACVAGSALFYGGRAALQSDDAIPAQTEQGTDRDVQPDTQISGGESKKNSGTETQQEIQREETSLPQVQEGDFSNVTAQIGESYIESSGTRMRITGTLTNPTDRDWTNIDLSFVLVDASGQPAEVAETGLIPELDADIIELEAGETKEFVSNWFPGVLESDYEKVADYRIEKFEYEE